MVGSWGGLAHRPSHCLTRARVYLPRRRNCNGFTDAGRRFCCRGKRDFCYYRDQPGAAAAPRDTLSAIADTGPIPMLKKTLLSLLVLLIIGLILITVGRQPAALDHNTYSYQMLQPGPYKFASEDITLEDDSRPTQANGDFPGSASRKLVTRLWLPEARALTTPQPLLIYSHGFMSSRIGGTHIAEHLASLGYIVAAPDFPLTHFNAPKPQLVKDVVNQPGDVSFIIDQLLARSRTQGDALYGAIDERRIAVAGLSLGGMTTSLVAFHPTMGDPRIAAAVSIAGPSFMFTPAFYQHHRLPFMMIASPIDAMVSYPDNALPIVHDVNDAVLVSITDASHAGFSYQSQALRWLDNPDALGCWAIKDKTHTAGEEPWYDTIGSPEQGVVAAAAPPLCATDPLPRSMNPIRQQWFATLAVTGFLQSLFAPQELERSRYRQFLLQQLAYENPEVTVQAGPGRFAQ